MSKEVKSQTRTGPSYYTKNPEAPIPENSASWYLGLKTYNPKFESYYENDYKKSGVTLPFSKYIGPKNSLNLGEPKTDADRAAKRHDIRYAWNSFRLANKRITQAQFEKNIQIADEQFQRENVLYSPHGLIGKSGIGIKSAVESITGQLYPGSEQHKSQFETAPEPHSFVPLERNKDLKSMTVPGEPPSKIQKVEEASTAQSTGTATAPTAQPTDIEMATSGLTGTGKGQASGGASSDGQMVHYIEKPLSIFTDRVNIYKKSHKFMTFGLAPAILPITSDSFNHALTSYLAEVPWHIPAFYLNPSEFALLNQGAHAIELDVEVYYRGSTIQFETNSTSSGLATLNQINDIAVAHGLNRSGLGSNFRFTSFNATQPMLPTGIRFPTYGPVAGVYRGMLRDYYGSNNPGNDFVNDIPKHQIGRQTFLYNYWTNTLRGGAASTGNSAQFGGWSCLASSIEQMDGKTVVNQCVAKSTYKPKMGLLKQPLRLQAHGNPFPITGGSELVVPIGGQFSDNKRVAITNLNAPSSSKPTQNNAAEFQQTPDNYDPEPTLNEYTPIEKSQWARSGFWGEQKPHIQPSLHIGVQPVPALTTTATLAEDSQFNQWTDTRAYWEIVATMKTKEHNPTIWPYATQANVPVGDVILFDPAAFRPANATNPQFDGATFGGLYTTSYANVA